MERRTGWIYVNPNPLLVQSLNEPGTVTVSWGAPGEGTVEVRVGAPDGPLFAKASSAGSQSTGPWVTNGTRFYLQDASTGSSVAPLNTIATVVVTIELSRVNSGHRRSLVDAAGALNQHAATVATVPPVGRVNFGDLRRLDPISGDWGFDRGRPIDRYYIEGFLQKYAAAIHGRVLEFGSDHYTRRFGGERVRCCDVLNVQEGIAGTTIRTDLTNCMEIPDNTFDCIVCTQVLQFIYDLPAAVRHIMRILKPGGTVLATFSGISCSFVPDWGYFHWSLTPASATLLFSRDFDPGNVIVEAFGNLLTSLAFLSGLSIDELNEAELTPRTAGYETVIALCARKRNDCD